LKAFVIKLAERLFEFVVAELVAFQFEIEANNPLEACSSSSVVHLGQCVYEQPCLLARLTEDILLTQPV